MKPQVDLRLAHLLTFWSILGLLVVTCVADVARNTSTELPTYVNQSAACAAACRNHSKGQNSTCSDFHFENNTRQCLLLMCRNGGHCQNVSILELPQYKDQHVSVKILDNSTSRATQSSDTEENVTMSTATNTSVTVSNSPTVGADLQREPLNHVSNITVSTAGMANSSQTVGSTDIKNITTVVSVAATTAKTTIKPVANTVARSTANSTTTTSTTTATTTNNSTTTTTSTTISSTRRITTENSTSVPSSTTEVKPPPRTTPKAVNTNATSSASTVHPTTRHKVSKGLTLSTQKAIVVNAAGSLTSQLVDTSSLLAVLLFGLIFFVVAVGLFLRQAYDSYKKKDYTQVDYLINGMYSDSGV